MTHCVADLERIEGRWVGFVRGLPGCFASDLSRHACIALLPNAIDRFSVWTGSLGDSDATEITIGEVHDAWLLHADYEVNAFFAVDREPLTTAAVSDGVRLLDRSHADLEVVVGGTTGVDLSREVEDGWSIERILNHIASAEWWYLDRLDLAPPRE